jgi:hypothetical protein
LKGRGFTGCGKTLVLYQGMASAMPKMISLQRALAPGFLFAGHI